MVVLKILRSKKTAKKIWIALAIIIIPAFCFWGFGSAMRGKKKPVFLGRVFNKSVSAQEYLKNYKAIRNQYLLQLGQEQFLKLEQYLNLENQVWQRVALLKEAKRRKIDVGNTEVVHAIKQNPFFQKQGVFNPAIYREVITYLFRSSPRAFEEEVRDNLIITKLYQQVTEGITVSDNKIKQAYIKENEQIIIEYILTSADDFLSETLIQEGELLDYYNNNTESFSKPISYNLEYIKISSNDKQKIDKIVQLLNQGFSLKDAAGDSDLQIKETGFFSKNEPIPQIGWSTEVLKIIPKLKTKGNVWPEPIQYGKDIVYFFGLRETKEPYIQAFDDVKDRVNQMLHQEKASKIAQEKLTNCRNEAKIIGFTQAAKKFNLTTDKTEPFKRGGYVEGLGDSNIFFEAVENLEVDQISELTTTPSGLFIVKLKQRIEPSQEKFEQENDEFSNNLLEVKKQEYFNQFLTELINKANISVSGI